MKRIVIPNLNGGIIDAADPLTIPDNACVEMLNYEFTDMLYPRFRKSATLSEMSGLFGDFSNLEVWYPKTLPKSCTDDKVYVVHLSNKMWVAYLQNGTLITTVALENVAEPSTMYVSPARVIVADGNSVCKYISINKDGEIESGDIGIAAPISMPSISAAGGDNKYVEVATIDTGMQVERGNILQYCYTVEDKYGSESNPSPVSTQDGMMYKYPSAESITGFAQYWYSAAISGLSIKQYSHAQRANLKQYNLYRRDIRFSEGVIGSNFVMVKSVPIGKSETATTTDSSSQNLAPISYNKTQAPPANNIIETDGVIFLANLKADAMQFPFQFDKYCEISITNDNAVDYVKPIIGIAITATDAGIPSFDQFLVATSKIRLFAQDMITPVPLMYKRIGEVLYCYIVPPYLNMESTNKLYLAFAITSSGVTDASWNSFRMGVPFAYGIDNWNSQPIFSTNKVLTDGTLITTEVPYAKAYITDFSSVFNLANMEAKGIIYTRSEAASNHLFQPADNSGYKVSPYSEVKELAKDTYVLAESDYIKYELPSTPTKNIMITLSANVLPRSVIVSSGYPWATVLFKCGNLRIVVVKRTVSSRYFITVLATTSDLLGANEYQYLFDTEVLQENVGMYNINMVAWVQNQTLLSIIDMSNGGIPISQTKQVTIEETIEYSDEVELFKMNSQLTIPTGWFNRLWKFTLANMPQLSTSPDASGKSEAMYACLCAHDGRSFFRSRVGTAGNNVTTDFDNASITFEAKEIIKESNPQQVLWSDVRGQSFSSLDFKNFREPVLGIIAAPSYMRLQYQNTIVVYTRNTISRIVLSQDLSTLAASANNIVEEQSSNGLYAPKSLVSGGGSLYWISEAGVMKWDQNGMKNISKGVINIPLTSDIVAVWVETNSQYMAYSPVTREAYVYHDSFGVWTKFNGTDIQFTKSSKMNLGTSTANKVMLINGSNMWEYPSTTDANVQHRITTKRFFTSNLKPVRLRGTWATPNPTEIIINCHNELFPDKFAEQSLYNVDRFKWQYIANGIWGEDLQISLDEVSGLVMMELDIKEEL